MSTVTMSGPMLKYQVNSSIRLAIIFCLAFLLAQPSGYGQFVIQDTKYIHHVFKHVENSGGYDGHLALDVNGDGVWDMAFSGTTAYNYQFPKSNSGSLKVDNLTFDFQVCRYGPSGNVIVPFYGWQTCYCLEDTIHTASSKKFDSSDPLIGTMSSGGGPWAWTKLDNAYAFFILESSPGVIDTGWVRFTSQVWISGFSINVHSIGTNTPGWNPIWQIFKENPKPIKDDYPDQDYIFLIPPDTTDQGGDTTIIEPPPPFVDSTFQAYPNPFSDELTVNLLDVKDIKRVELINFNGLTVYQQILYKAEIVKIPSTHLPPGPYILRVVRYAHPPMMLRVVHIQRKE